MEKVRGLSARMFRKESLIRCVLNNCHGTCCSYGVWIDLHEKEKILENSDVIITSMDNFTESFENWFEETPERDLYTESGWVIHSKLIQRSKPFYRNTCIFIRDDHKCALQVASEKLGKHPWTLKPFYCILHPMDLNTDGEITLDETEIILKEPKSCLRPSTKSYAPIEIFEEELRYLLGDYSYNHYLGQAQILWDLKPDEEIE
jgi:hypothetical protein